MPAAAISPEDAAVQRVGAREGVLVLVMVMSEYAGGVLLFSAVARTGRQGVTRGGVLRWGRAQRQ